MLQEQNQHKLLKIYSILFIFLAGVDVIEFILDYASGQMSIAFIMENAGVDAALAKVSLIIAFVLFAITVLLKLFLGIQGYRQTQGLVKGTAHIKLAWVALVVIAITCISALVALTNGSGSWTDLCTPVIGLSIVGGYIKEAKDEKYRSSVDPGKKNN